MTPGVMAKLVGIVLPTVPGAALRRPVPEPGGPPPMPRAGGREAS